MASMREAEWPRRSELGFATCNVPSIRGIPGSCREYAGLSLKNGTESRRHGVSTATKRSSDPCVQSVEVSDELITARLVDGRTISVPLAWSWRLLEATPEQRRTYEILDAGHGIRWPEIDEDISIRGMLEGVPAQRPRPS